MILLAEEAVINVARSYLWVRETNGANRGEMVDQLVRACGMDPTKRLAWCAAFATTAGVGALGSRWPLPRVMGCMSLFDAAKAKGFLRAQPARGALFLQWKYVERENVWRFAHTGIITSDRAPWTTIEGNSNKAGSRDGDGVFEQTRNWQSKDVFVHWWETPAA
ncbi:MAG: hypothetical protein HOP28_12185 [Gemmatimonadales bacterium]|nr:hypothetical protein [Gemmatimonadales bacterium]